MPAISRPDYLSRLIDLSAADVVKVITGVRRCGKSTLLELFAQHLQEQGILQDRILRLNYEQMVNDRLRDPAALHQFVEQRINEVLQRNAQGAQAAPYDQLPQDHSGTLDLPRFYLLIDEAQEIESWARTVNSLRTSFPVDIYVTGSNSRLFAGEDLTYLTGRYVELKMYPLAFSEYVRFREALPETSEAAGSPGSPGSPEPPMLWKPSDVRTVFSRYLSDGSFPAVALAKSPEVIQALNAGLVDSVIMRDVVQRGHIDDDSAFRLVAQYAFENIGCELSATNIANTLKSRGRKISIATVDRYLALMCDAFVLYKCVRYDLRGKERLRNNAKYYIVDTGLRNVFLGERPSDMGHILENLVYLELLRRGYEVAYSRDARTGAEIDFVAFKNKSRIYVQVAQTVASEEVKEREFASLLKVKDGYPKYLMSMDELDQTSSGIAHMNILDFLSGTPLFQK